MNATLFSNHNLSRSDISVRYVFQKMFSPKGTLVAVECLSRFDSLSISPENFFRYANTGLRESIFMEQLALIEKHKQWFNKNGISATINVDDHILNILLRPEIKNLVGHIGCVHFEVTENSNKLLNNALATWSDPQVRRSGSMILAQAMRVLARFEATILIMSKSIKTSSGI
jgi:hypothetical protein